MPISTVAATVLLFLGAGALAYAKSYLQNFCASWPQWP